MVPGPALSKSVRNDEFPVSTSPAAGFPVVESTLRSDGKELVIALEGPSSAFCLRRRMNMNAPPPISARTPSPPARYAGFSISSSVKLGGGGGAFLGAAFGGVLAASALGLFAS